MNPSPRLASLDQFRGYTVLAMFVVNFVGGLASVPDTFKHHHTYCSFADTVMPQFLFAVGVGMRLSFVRRREREGAAAAYRHILWRCLGLLLLGVVVYHLTGNYQKWDDLMAQNPGEFVVRTLKRGPFEALVHIAVASLWALPVIAAPGWGRALFAAGSGALHVGVSHAGYYEWNLAPPWGIDGGPLGFLTWVVPLIAGTLAYDWLATGDRVGAKLVGTGLALMALAYALSLQNPTATPPFVKPDAVSPDYWLMSQRAGSVTYTAFGAGFACVVFAAFRVLCDGLSLRWAYLDLLGRHALIGYVLHGMVSGAVRPFVPKDSPLWWVLLAVAVYLGVITLMLRHLDRHNVHLKL